MAYMKFSAIASRLGFVFVFLFFLEGGGVPGEGMFLFALLFVMPLFLLIGVLTM